MGEYGYDYSPGECLIPDTEPDNPLKHVNPDGKVLTMSCTETRRAVVTGGSRDTVAAYLPANYSVVATGPDGVVVEGQDVAGWTLEDYVVPRLASGLMWAREVKATVPTSWRKS